MTTYLGITAKALALIAAAFVTFVTAASITLHATEYGAPCDSEDGAPCVTEAEDADVLAACAKTNGASLTVEQCEDYLRINALVTAACGDLLDQHAYEDCEAATLAEGS